MSWLQVLRRHVSRVPVAAGEAEILSWAYSPALGDNVLHRHTYFEVCTVGRWGSGTFTLAGRAHAIGPGDTFFARPGELHRIQNTGPQFMELFWVSFALAPPRSTSVLPALADTSLAVRASDAPTLAIWNALAEAARLDGNCCREMLRFLSSALLFSIGRSDDEAPRPVVERASLEDEHVIARLAIRYIHDNLDRRLPIEEVAAHVHVSPRHLSRLFRLFAGTSPADYIEAARIQRARHLLGHERASIQQAARAVGYGDARHFSRAFSRRVGASPSEFRARRGDVMPRLRKDGELV